MKSLGSLFVVLLLVQMSTQQFSYSANWGKRKADYTFETECLAAFKLKEIIESTIIHLDRRVMVIIISQETFSFFHVSLSLSLSLQTNTNSHLNSLYIFFFLLLFRNSFKLKQLQFAETSLWTSLTLDQSRSKRVDFVVRCRPSNNI